MTPLRSRRAASWACVALLATVSVAGAARTTVPPPRSTAEADSLLSHLPPSKERLAAYRTWTGGASLDDLMYLLRRPAAQLGDLETPLVTAALGRAPSGRAELRERLAARQSVAAHRGSRDAPPEPLEARPIPAFHVTLLLPADGDHADEAAALETGFRAGLASRAAPNRPAIACGVARTGGDEPADVAVAFDSVAAGTALVCGGFQHASAELLAAASRWNGVPVLLAAPDDAGTARLAPRVWSMGPTAGERGAALAEAAKVGPTDHVGVITSSASDTAFAAGFVAACRGRGALSVARFGYAPGNTSFAAEARALINQKCSVLFWDGDASEAAALLRQLTRERVSIRICGGDGLDPARHHKESRLFLEGVLYVGADWTLTAGSQAELDARLSAAVAPSNQALAVRGWLAGRIAGAALATPAYTPDEIAAAISAISPRESNGLRLMGVKSQGAELPVYRVAAGRSTRNE